MQSTVVDITVGPAAAQSATAGPRHPRWHATTPAEPDAPPSARDPLATTRPADLYEVMVMMVDDEAMLTDVIQTYLEEAGYRRLVAVNDPLQAMAALRRDKPGLLLLDLMMPGLSGFEILAQVRSDEALRYTPVIMLTAANDPATRLKALELGATEFLAKPVDPSELVLRVRNSLAFKVYQDRLINEDSLTGLPNQRVFSEQLQAVLARAKGENSALAVLHIGLDRFKQINDSLGHSAGDRLLKAVAQRLRPVVRRSDSLLLSRLDGDTFGLVMPRIESTVVAESMARRILAAMSLPFSIAGLDLFVTPSIGISVFPGDGPDDATLRRNAVAAMAHAKSSGRNTFEFYSSALKSGSLDSLSLEMQLRHAIARNELVLHYQPKIDLATGRIAGAEALLRWHRPGVGMVSPAQFIPVAEESGLIVDIGEWVIATACAQMAAWRGAGLGDVKVAINVTRHDLAAGGLVRAVTQALARHAIGRGQLAIELTESMLVDRVDQTREQLEALRGLGVELAIDDFGTGYSSMNYLKRFPFDELKIDKSFIDGTPHDATDGAIVKALIVLAHSLGMRVVAEGVEKPAQRDLLLSLDCDSFQGFLFSKALPAEDFQARMLEVNSAAPGA